MKHIKRRFYSLIVAFLMLLSLVQSKTQPTVLAYEDSQTPTDSQLDEESTDESDAYEIMLLDLYEDSFHVATLGPYVKDILSGNGIYFSEIHNFFTCIGPASEHLVAYCVNPARTAPDASTPYNEYENGNLPSFVAGNKASATAVMMYGYGGESSINNNLLGLLPANSNVGGSFGIYVINGVAKTGLLINGTFYQLTPMEAQAVTAAAIHKLNGSTVLQITGTPSGHATDANNALYALYDFGTWTRNNIDAQGYTATKQAIEANAKSSRSLSLKIKMPDGTLQNLPSGYNDRLFDWSPYIKNGQLAFEACYSAEKCESKLIPSNQSGTKENIKFSHDSALSFDGIAQPSGYYDYLEVVEASGNTVPISVTYHKLESSSSNVFSQRATITVNASDLNAGKLLNLSVNVPTAVAFTPFYGDGDGMNGSYNAARVFASSGYQDMVVASPHSRLTSLSSNLSFSLETSGTFTITKYGRDIDGNATPLEGAGFMACNTKDLVKVDGAYQFDSSKAVVLAADGSKELFTDANGRITTTPILFGDYLIRETTVPNNYLAVDDFIVTINRSTVKNPPSIDQYDEPFVVYVMLTKVDAITGNPIINNPAEFRIWSYDKANYIDTENLYTDDSGVLKTASPLPVGDYRFEEVMPPNGYYLSSDCPCIDFSIDQTIPYETYEDGSFGYEFTYSNQPLRGIVEIFKTGESRIYNEESKEFDILPIALSEVTFDLYAEEDLYEADGSKTLIYKNGEVIETLITDENGYCCSTKRLPSGTYRLHEYVPKDYEAIDDIIFTISDEDPIIEQSIDSTISKTILKTLNIHNKKKEPTMETSAIDLLTLTKKGAVAQTDMLSDLIMFSNLTEGDTYTIKGVLIDKETSEPLLIDGQMVESDLTFVCEQPDGNVKLDFTLDSSELYDKDVVIYERMYQADEMICVHEDIENTKQTITYPTKIIPDDITPAVAPKLDVPKTGDSSPLILFSILFVISFISIIFFIFRKIFK